MRILAVDDDGRLESSLFYEGDAPEPRMMLSLGPNARSFDNLPLQVQGSLALIEVNGLLVPWRTFNWLTWRRSYSTQDYRAAVQAARDSSVDTAVVYVRSPGGTDWGTYELAEELWQLRQLKRVVIYSDQLCCSAAYWMASQGTEFVSSPLADIGAIGAYVLLANRSKARSLEEWGEIPELVRTGGEASIKGDSAAGIFSEGLKEMWMDSLENGMLFFKAAVMRGRQLSEQQFEGLHVGKFWNGENAQQRGLVDRIVPTFNQLLEELTNTTTNRGQGETQMQEEETPGAAPALTTEEVIRSLTETLSSLKPSAAEDGVVAALSELNGTVKAMAEENRAQARSIRELKARSTVRDMMADLGEIPPAMSKAGLEEFSIALAMEELPQNPLATWRAILEAVPKANLLANEEVAGEDPEKPGHGLSAQQHDLYEMYLEGGMTEEEALETVKAQEVING